jgi:hypothetical protein
MVAHMSHTCRYSSASLASSSHTCTSCTTISEPPSAMWEACLAPGSGRVSGAYSRLVCAVGMFVDDDHEALMCSVVASDIGVVEAAELVVRSVKEPLEHHRV